MEYQSYTLPNGIRIVHLPADTPVCYCGYAVNAGTRDELVAEYGMAHFTEHMLFKGTSKRRSHHILNRMESVGGEINAYTTKEDTFVYSIFLEPHFERGVELLSDILFHSIFPSSEIEKEKEVVLDEINSYKDNPSELIFDEFENMLFNGHELGRNILGEENTIEAFSSEAVSSFVSRTYLPSEIVFFSLGRIDFKKVTHLIHKFTEGIEARFGAHPRFAPESYTPRKEVIAKDTHQCHAIIGNRAFGLYEEMRRSSFYLLNNILGGPGMNSRLNVALREKRGWVYNVESSFVSFTDTGVFSVYFGCDPKNVERCLNGVYKELRRFRNERLTTAQLEAAKKQVYGQIGVSTDNRENLSLSMGKSFLRFNKFDSLEELFGRIDKITSSDLLDVANEVFEESLLTSLIYK
ncbi:MAG: M16 family metallopeptidase [Bacteroidales bacterium]